MTRVRDCLARSVAVPNSPEVRFWILRRRDWALDNPAIPPLFEHPKAFKGGGVFRALPHPPKCEPRRRKKWKSRLPLLDFQAEWKSPAVGPFDGASFSTASAIDPK